MVFTMNVFKFRGNQVICLISDNKLKLTMLSSLMIVLFTVRFCLFRYLTATCCRFKKEALSAYQIIVGGKTFYFNLLRRITVIFVSEFFNQNAHFKIIKIGIRDGHKKGQNTAECMLYPSSGVIKPQFIIIIS